GATPAGHSFAPVGELESPRPCHGRDRRFKSGQGRCQSRGAAWSARRSHTAEVAGSNPAGTTDDGGACAKGARVFRTHPGPVRFRPSPLTASMVKPDITRPRDGRVPGSTP